jgi:hypothetical protein
VISPRFDRRRADRFARLLDGDEVGTRTHRDSEPDAADLAQLARRLSGLREAPDPDPGFRAGLRGMLLAKMERDEVGGRSAHAATRAALTGKTQAVRQVPVATGRTRLALLAGVTAGALALSGVSAASTDALPGEPLYQIKRSTERAQLALAGSDHGRGRLYLEFARVRLAEAYAVDPGRDGPDPLPSLLADMDAETREAMRLIGGAAVTHADPESLAVVLSFAAEQRRLLDTLRRTAPPADAAALYDSARLLADIARRADDLRAALLAGCAPTAVDDLGPVPTAC